MLVWAYGCCNAVTSLGAIYQNLRIKAKITKTGGGDDVQMHTREKWKARIGIEFLCFILFSCLSCFDMYEFYNHDVFFFDYELTH